MEDINAYNIAVLLPCHNEALTIADTVKAFKAVLPNSKIYVYDNNSNDSTAEIAKQHGAIIGFEPNQGKGNVVRRMFADIEADLYVLADGDNTCDASKANEMIVKLLSLRLDVVVGSRLLNKNNEIIYRRGHYFGNKLSSSIVSIFFGRNFTDILSGYRVFSRRFVKSFPAKSRKFDIESELTIHALEQRLPMAEIYTYNSIRPEGSSSKLRTYNDGIHILWRIIVLLKIIRPMLFFSTIGVIFALISIGIFLPVLITFFQTDLIPRLPTAILSTGIMLVAISCFVCGIILDNVSESRKEINRLFYLSLPYLNSNKEHK